MCHDKVDVLAGLLLDPKVWTRTVETSMMNLESVDRSWCPLDHKTPSPVFLSFCLQEVYFLVLASGYTRDLVKILVEVFLGFGFFLFFFLFNGFLLLFLLYDLWVLNLWFFLWLFLTNSFLTIFNNLRFGNRFWFWFWFWLFGNLFFWGFCVLRNYRLASGPHLMLISSIFITLSIFKIHQISQI